MTSNRPSPLGATDTTVIKCAIPDEMATVLNGIAADGYESRSDLVRMIVSDWLHNHEDLWLPASLKGHVEWRDTHGGKRPGVVTGPMFGELLGQVRVWSMPEMRRIARRYNLTDTQVVDVMVALGYPRDEWPVGPNRKAIPNGVRWVVSQRSGGRCEADDCGEKATTMHHVVHRVAGGLNVPVNLKHLCGLCHTNEHRDDAIPKPSGAQALSNKAKLRRLRKRLDQPTAPVMEYWRVYDRKGAVLGEYPSEESAEREKPPTGHVKHVIL